jgi:predicted transcriptional regulator of viral defense system
MPRFSPDRRPSYEQLYQAASAQEGLFSAEQATAAGYSLPLLAHYLKTGRVERVSRGIYRLAHFPPGEHEDLVALWLWSKQTAVFSHETALSLQDLSDALPSRVHATLPTSWQKRRLRVPPLLYLHFADVPAGDRAWIGAVPVTNPARTLNDCASSHVAPDFVHQALRAGLVRGLFSPEEVVAAEQYVTKYGRSA